MEATTKPKLLMLKGLPASGKTTYAKELEQQGWTRVNKDDIRSIFSIDYTLSNEKDVEYMEDADIIAELREGNNVVVDDTNFNPERQERLENIAEAEGAEFEVLFIDTPLEECIKRNKKRPNSVPMDAILDMHRQYIAPLRDEKQEYDDELDEAIVVDVDGTLAHIDDSNPRSPHDGSRAMEDLLDDTVSVIVAMFFNHGYRVIILTGRNSEHLEVTKEWLEANGVEYDDIHAREEGDTRPDYVFKKEVFDKHIRGKYNIKFVIDDRPQVCRMWRSLGLKTLQVGDPHYEF